MCLDNISASTRLHTGICVREQSLWTTDLDFLKWSISASLISHHAGMFLPLDLLSNDLIERVSIEFFIANIYAK